MLNENAIMLYLLRTKLPLKKMCWHVSSVLQNRGVIYGFQLQHPRPLRELEYW